MPKIVIEAVEIWEECDCCGSYDTQDIKVTLDDKLILEHSGDSHLQGGVWYDWSHALKPVLESLGYEVEVLNSGYEE